jgi:flagellin
VRINTNLAAIDTQRNLNSVQSALSKSVERLSSGLRINRAGDDAAGLTISEKLRGQVRGLNQAMRNAQDGISMIQTAEGGLNESHSIIQRMRELAVQGSNDTLTTEDQAAIGSELVALRDELNRISDTTEFNTKTLLDGSIRSSVDTTTSGLLEGESMVVGAAGQVTVSKLDVSNAKAGATFTFAAGSAADKLLATNAATGESQEVTITDMATTGASTQELNFSNLGVSITLSGFHADNTAASIRTAMVAQTNVVTTGTGAAAFQVGANANQVVNLSIGSARSDSAGFGQGGTYATLSAAVADFNGGPTTAKAQNLIMSLDDALADVSQSRSNLGAVQNRLEHTIENLAVSSENLSASESRIRDADMAKEMVGFTRSNILQQAGTSILAQANQLPQGVLSLLR